jgi:hypothetical protein
MQRLIGREMSGATVDQLDGNASSTVCQSGIRRWRRVSLATAIPDHEPWRKRIFPGGGSGAIIVRSSVKFAVQFKFREALCEAAIRRAEVFFISLQYAATVRLALAATKTRIAYRL